MTRRRALMFLVVVLVGLAAGLVGQDPAGADINLPIIGDCKTPPAATTPDSGLSSFFGADTTPPPEGDPFAPNPTVSIADAYGPGGVEWATYDHCVPNPWEEFVTGISNLMMILPQSLMAATAALGRVAQDPHLLDPFNGPIKSVSAQLLAHPVPVLLSVALIVLAIYLVAHAHRMETHHAVNHLLRALVAVGLTMFVLTAPLIVVDLLSGAIRLPVEAVKEATGNTAGPLSDVGAIHRQLGYNTWLAGEFGSADSETAKTFGPDLWRATHFSRAEWAKVKDDPAARKQAFDDKGTLFKTTAQRVQDTDTEAYANLTGQRPTVRFEWAGIFTLVTPMGLLLILVAGVLFVVALIEFRFGVFTVPFIAAHSLVSPGGGHMGRLGNRLLATGVRVVTYYLAAGIMVQVNGAIMSAPGTTPFVMVLLMATASVVAWTFLLHRWAKHGVGIGRAMHKRVRGDTPSAATQRAITQTQILGQLAQALERMAPAAAPEAAVGGAGGVDVSSNGGGHVLEPALAVASNGHHVTLGKEGDGHVA